MVNAKLKVKGEKGYLRLEQVSQLKHKSPSPNCQLMKELKLHRINKFK
jgi:hypothetical protein